MNARVQCLPRPLHLNICNDSQLSVLQCAAGFGRSTLYVTQWRVAYSAALKNLYRRMLGLEEQGTASSRPKALSTLDAATHTYCPVPDPDPL